jgi:fatty-acyl-CoA synthase
LTYRWIGLSQASGTVGKGLDYDGEADLKAFIRMLREIATSKPDKIALYYGDRQISYFQLEQYSSQVANGMTRLGIRDNDRVAIWLPNVPAFVTLLFACFRIGAVAVTVNTRFRSVEVGDILYRTGAKALVLWPGFKGVPFLDVIADIDRAALEKLETVIVYDEGEEVSSSLPFGSATVVRYAELLNCKSSVHGEASSEGGITFTTSGTTSAPKFVRHGQSGSAHHGVSMAKAFGFDAADAKVLIAAPLCGIFGYSQFVGSIAAGASMELASVIDVERIVRSLRNGVTNLHGSDTMFRRILASVPETIPFPRLMPTPLAPFEYPPEETILLGDARGIIFLGAYGMTEIMGTSSRQPSTLPARERAKGGGYLISGDARIRVRDPDTGDLLPPGAIGEFEFQSPSVMLEYLDNPDATAAAFTEDRFLRTGDIGCLEADGRILYEARRIEMARLGGFLVNPIEIEAQLLRHPTVAFAQVVVVSAPEGNKAVGFVVMQPGSALNEEAVREMCLSSMARYKVPARIIALPKFPVADGVNGAKIQRSKLRELATSVMNTD